jgi:nitroreductase
MELRELVLKTRSYRRFHEEVAIDTEILRGLVDLARLSGSGANLQPLKFMLVNDPGASAEVYPHLGWAGYLQDWPGPDEGERPSAYIVILGDTEVSASFGVDWGIAAQSIMLGASEKGLGGCMIGSVSRPELREVLGISQRFKILLVLALGRPKEKVVIDPVGPDGSIKYWRDGDGVHHVPKRDLDDLIVS